MAYKLIVTEHADELLDNLVQHLLERLKNEQAARHLLAGIENVYERLEENLLQFPLSRDTYLCGAVASMICLIINATAPIRSVHIWGSCVKTISY